MAAQIGGYLSEDEHKTFKDYAASLGVSESSLANLLILRELRKQRLADLSSFASPVPSNQRKRVTAHQRNSAPKVAFEALCKEVGLSPDLAATVLLRAELHERWLSNCVSG